MQKYNANNQNENESFIQIFIKTLSRIGNVLIIAFGVIFFGIKKIFTSFKKGGDNETLSQFVKKLEDQLNASSKHYDLKQKTKESVKPKTSAPLYNKSGGKAASYESRKPAKTVTVKNKYTPKSSAPVKMIKALAAIVVMGGFIFLIVIAVKGIFNGSNKSMKIDNAEETVSATESTFSQEDFYYYRMIDSYYINSEITEFQEEIQAEDSPEAVPSATSMICGDEPLATGETVEKAETTPELSQEASIEPTTTPEPDVTMDISSAVFSKDILIHKGDTLDEVALIQERLMDLHYMDADEPTAYYGEVTHYAMQLFQRGHDLMVDGVAGYETLTLLFSEEATPYLVRQGDYGFDIYVIKNRLIELGYLNDDDSGKKFDENTDYAVRVFQGRNKLSQDGIVGYNTTQVLFNGDAKAASNYTPPTSSDSDSSSSSSAGASYDANSASDFVAFAKSCLDKGYTYVWGGKSPPGMDCSGFVYYCLNATGNSTGYMTSAAWAQSSYTSISSIHDVKAGDILCFSGHVAICIGNGKMIDSSSSSNTIRIANFEDSSYWNRKWICGKRYFD